jgi:hypothetical protein
MHLLSFLKILAANIYEKITWQRLEGNYTRFIPEGIIKSIDASVS